MCRISDYYVRYKGFNLISVSHFRLYGEVRGSLYGRCIAGAACVAGAWFILTISDHFQMVKLHGHFSHFYNLCC